MGNKFYHLEGLRGIAALVVVIAHYLQFYFLNAFFVNPDSKVEYLLAKTPLNLFYNANFAVCIFFVLSGYVLSNKYFREKNSSYVQSSASRRYFRLAIPVFFSVLVAYTLLITDSYKYFTSITGDLRYENMSHNFLLMIKQTFYDVFFKYSNPYNTVLWTMTYELFGSFLVFSYLLLFGNFRKRIISYILLIIIFINSYYLAFVLGIIISDFENSKLAQKKLFNNIYLNLIILFIGIYFGSYPYGKTDNTIYSIISFKNFSLDLSVFYHIIGSFLLIYFLLFSNKLKSFFSNFCFVYLGRISFSLYLIHFPILASFSFIFFNQLTTKLNYYYSFVISSTISLLLTFFISHFLSKYIDEKSVILSKKISSRLFENL